MSSTYLAFGKPNFGCGEVAAVKRVLESGWVGVGPETIAFEREISKYVGSKNVLAVNSCTSALFLSLLALGVQPGDEVIVPSLTWCSSANAILYAGATPVFCDVDVDTLSITLESVHRVISKKTKAVIYVHFGGLAGDIVNFKKGLPDNIAVVEDAAHAFGSCYPQGNKVGSSGNLTCFSFYANKNLSTGDGGAIATDDALLYEKLRLLSQQGLPADAWKRYSDAKTFASSDIKSLGYKMNYNDVLASIGRVQLKRQDKLSELRRKVADCYFSGLSASDKISFQVGVNELFHSLHLFTIVLSTERMGPSRDEVQMSLRKRGIGASVHYYPLHRMSFYKTFCQAKLDNTNFLANKLLTLPIGPCVSTDNAQYVVNSLLEIIS